MPAPTREVKKFSQALFLYILYTSNNKAAVPWRTDHHYSVTLFLSPILRHLLTVSLTYTSALQVQGKHSRDCWGNWTVGGSDWGAISKQVSINRVFSIVLVSPIPLSAADLYAGLGNKQLYLINYARETCTFCLLSKYCILAVRGGRDRFTTVVNSSLVYCSIIC